MKEYSFRGEIKYIDEVIRNAAPGQFVKLTDGITHYEIAGPLNETLTVLIHGFSVPYFIWDPTFDGLVSAGLRTLRYDLFGRGYSDRPDIVYNRECYERQLFEILEALNIDKPINLIGLSMGGAIAVGFADKYSELVGRLALIAPAGMPEKQSPLMFLMHIPGVGEWMFDVFAEKLIVRALVKDAYTRNIAAKLEAKYRVQMQYRGFKRALISTIRHGPLQSMTKAYKRVGRHPRPVLLIWGKEDQTVPYALNHKVRSALPNAVFYVIERAGHIPHYTEPELVNQLLIDFLIDGNIRQKA
jgi:pimeloyl-ACP methyl ester carboxylesterase